MSTIAQASSVDPSTLSFQTYTDAPVPPSTLSGGAIAGIVIAAIVLVALFVVIAFLAYGRNKQPDLEKSEDATPTTLESKAVEEQHTESDPVVT